MVGELATGHVAQVQFQVGWCALVVRRIGHRVAAAVAIAQQKLHILPGVVLERFGGRRCSRSVITSSDTLCKLLTRTGIFSRGRPLPSPGATPAPHRWWGGAAGQHPASRFFLRAQGLGLVGPCVHIAREFEALARATGTVFAAVGHAHAFTDGGGQ